MNQSLILDGNIAVIRNTYERAVFHYTHSFNYIGFDNWLREGNLKSQVTLYKDCKHFIDFNDWKNELSILKLAPKDTSVMEGQVGLSDYKNWYTLRSIHLVSELYIDELKSFGFSY